MQTAPKIFGGKVSSHLLAFFDGDSDEAEATTEGLRAVAADFKGQVGLFVCAFLIKLTFTQSVWTTQYLGVLCCLSDHMLAKPCSL